MVDYGNTMSTAIVPSPNAGVPGRGRADRREFLLSRVVPALLASLFVAGQLAFLGDSVPAVARAGATPTDWMTFLNRFPGLAFLVLLVVLTAASRPECAAHRARVPRWGSLRQGPLRRRT